MRHIIGFAGPIGSGKSQAAKYLVDWHGFTRTRFAAPLKAMLKAAGLNDEELDGSLKEKPCPKLCGHTPRWAQQSLGTEWGRRKIHPDLWVTLWASSLPADDNIVVDDVRFPNEVKAVRDLGGNVIRIVRPGHEPSDKHASEQELECDYMMPNAGNLDELYERVSDFVNFEELGI